MEVAGQTVNRRRAAAPSTACEHILSTSAEHYGTLLPRLSGTLRVVEDAAIATLDDSATAVVRLHICHATSRPAEQRSNRFENITVIETRAALATTDLGTAREYGPNGLQAPRILWRSPGIPTTAPDGYAGVVPQFTLAGGVALVGEGVNHAEFDGVNPDAVAIGRAVAWSTLTSEALLSTSITEVSAAHARIIAKRR
jgi:hypothetical protein